MGNLDFLLQDMHFKKYLDSAHNPKKVLDRWEKMLDTNKVHELLNTFPKTLDKDEKYSSLLMNLTIDYNQIINRLPKGFSLIESNEPDSTHVDNTNQIDIYFNDILSKGINEPSTFKVACMSFYFLDTKKGKELRIENIQGEISTASGYFSDNEIKRVFGKLSTFYSVNWKQGLLQQVYDYGKEQGMTIKGELPGIFYFYSHRSSLPEYPIYTLDYLTTYLKIGIPLDNIIIRTVPEDIKSRWEKTFSFLRTKTDEEKVSFVKQAADAYRKEFRQNKNDLYKHQLALSAFENNCKKTYERVFSEVFL
jgi:hypothetical protein